MSAGMSTSGSIGRHVLPGLRSIAAGLRLLLAVALGLLVMGAVAVAPAVEIDFTPRPVLRKVLAVYDGAAEGAASDSRIHRFAEMPINHLGFEVVYRDVNGPLPDVAEMRGYRAVLTWLLEPLKAPEKYGAWLDSVLSSQGLRHVVLGEILPDDSEKTEHVAIRLFQRLGLDYTGEHLEIGFAAKPQIVDAAMIGFERPLDKVLPDFPVLRPMTDRVAVHLSLSVPNSVPSGSAVVTTGSTGGYAAGAFTFYYEPTADREMWILNPFAFFSRALGAERFPMPDVTTVAGRRIYFSHIDGDGWNNQTEIEKHRGVGMLSSEVILREAIAKFPDLPVSVALIGCDIDPQYGADAAAARVARELFALPQVEVASHTHTHPFNWNFFAKYDRNAEMAKIDSYQRPLQSWRESLTEQVYMIAGKPAPLTRSNKYVAGSDDLPRTYLKNPFDLGSEVVGALRTAEKLAPGGKRAKIYQWSGDTTPFEAAIRETRRAGVRNINGGDSRLDREFPSVAYVPPISRVIGAERQIYAANSNENTYTNDWTGPYHGFFMLEETLRNTDAPRRLKPFNLYYHMYSGEKPAALSAVQHFLKMARSTAVTPIAASDYAAIADDFFGVTIEQVGASAWAVENRGALETVRFDEANELGVDLAASTGVLGATRHNGSLYVTLDREVARAVIRLVPRLSAEAAVVAAGARPALRDSRWRLSAFSGEECRFSLQAQGFGKGDMNFLTAPGRRFDVVAMRGGKALASASATADASGLLAVSLDSVAVEPVALEFACHD